jgi:hypothetical protein
MTVNLKLPDIVKDLCRFADLHSWYKHLSVDPGVNYYAYPAVGQQPRYTFDTRITDSTGIHWHFVTSFEREEWSDEEWDDRIIEESLKHPINLGTYLSFLDVGPMSCRYWSNDWLERTYPDLAQKYNSSTKDEVDLEVCSREHERYKTEAIKAANAVWAVAESKFCK